MRCCDRERSGANSLCGKLGTAPAWVRFPFSCISRRLSGTFWDIPGLGDSRGVNVPPAPILIPEALAGCASAECTQAPAAAQLLQTAVGFVFHFSYCASPTEHGATLHKIL